MTPASQGLGGIGINRPNVRICGQFSPDEMPSDAELQRPGDEAFDRVVGVGQKHN